jgi:hypothetical protein
MKDDFVSEPMSDGLNLVGTVPNNVPKYVGQKGADGMKYDNGKLLAAIPFQDFPRALKAIAEISTYGAKKYKRSSWKTVPNAQERYEDAEFRHYLDMAIEGKRSRDRESGLMHMAHRAWNVLAVLELELMNIEQEISTVNVNISIGETNGNK